MDAWRFDTFGLEHLRRVTEKDTSDSRSALHPHEIRVRLRAASLNFRDLMMVRGHYDPRMALPLVPLSDGAGEVVEVGASVTRFSEGDRVAGVFAPKWIAGDPDREALRHTRGGPIPGMLQTEVTGNADGFVTVPAHLSFEEAATLPCAGVTAWNALKGVRAGERVLTLGTGGVSIFALQLAQSLGAQVIVTSSQNEKLERAKELGAAGGINYKDTPAWGKAALELAGQLDGRAGAGRGVDRVIELGGAGTLEQSLRAVRPGGEIAFIGVLSGAKTELLLTRIFMNAVTVRGILVGHRQDFEAMNRAVAAAKIKPVIDKVFDFADAPSAFEYLSKGDHFGKVCIRMPEDD